MYKKLFVMVFWLSSVPTLAEDAHIHGVGSLEIAAIDKKLKINLISPAFNVFGFAHAPLSDVEKRHVLTRTKRLKAPDLFKFNSDAECEMLKVELVNTKADGHGRAGEEQHAEHKHQAEHKHEEHEHEEHKHEEHEHEEHKHERHESAEAHSDITVHYSFNCQNLTSIDVKHIFKFFPEFKRIKVSMVTAKSQRFVKLDASNTTINLYE